MHCCSFLLNSEEVEVDVHALKATFVARKNIACAAKRNAKRAVLRGVAVSWEGGGKGTHLHRLLLLRYSPAGQRKK
jgi:hypothetical protein